MKIRLEVEIQPTKDVTVYRSLEFAEEFLTQLFLSNAAKELAIKCQVEQPTYIPANVSKLHRALGFFNYDKRYHTFACWEKEGNQERKFQTFAFLSDASEFNGDIGRKWKASGGDWKGKKLGYICYIAVGNL